MKIAVDGPSGAGKSTVAKMLAAHYGIVYVDTGALYRSVGLFVRRAGADPQSEAEVSPLLDNISLEMKYTDEGQRVIMCGEDVSDLIRTTEASVYASQVSTLPAVRAFLLGIQRDMAERGGVIMDGRDIGTVIMPDADVKIYLVASERSRAERRWKELRAKGEDCTVEEVMADMKKRDEKDSGRAVAPAVAAPDAVQFDNSGMSPDETVAALTALIDEKTGK